MREGIIFLLLAAVSANFFYWAENFRDIRSESPFWHSLVSCNLYTGSIVFALFAANTLEG